MSSVSVACNFPPSHRVGLVGVSSYTHDVSLQGGCVLNISCLLDPEFNRSKCIPTHQSAAPHPVIVLGWWVGHLVRQVCLYGVGVLWVSCAFGIPSLTVHTDFPLLCLQLPTHTPEQDGGSIILYPRRVCTPCICCEHLMSLGSQV